MTRYAVRAANITEIIDLVEADSPQAAIDLAQEQAGKTFFNPAAISAAKLRIHLDNEDGKHLEGSWYDCVRCGWLPEPEPTQEPESVDIIASGYEWNCPKDECGALNHEVEVKDWVVCLSCGRGFTTNPPNHAEE
jgi:hypothetical protein